ncbi:MAG: hypothetical protein P0121_02585 [Nitrospira sp.]|nr:hypothetical protein [Nitrospira sp.]
MWLDAGPKAARPAVLRGDVALGNESVLREAEERDQPSRTTRRVTKQVQALLKTRFRSTAWEEAGQGWEGGMRRRCCQTGAEWRLPMHQRPIPVQCSFRLRQH